MAKLLVIGHRGASGYKPENTLLSFKKALKLKVAMIELDVHLCKSGEIVVIHDYTVNRTTNSKGKIAEKNLAELKSLSARKKEKIPTLSEVLDLVNKKARINIELKGKKTAKAVLEVIRRYVQEKEWKFNDFLVSSFRKRELIIIKKLNYQINLGYIPRIPYLLWNFVEKIKASTLVINHRWINQGLIKIAHQKKIKVFAYTVNKPKEIEKMKQLKVDGIITDYPDRIIKTTNNWKKSG